MKSIFFVHKKSLEWFIYTGTGDGWASVFAHFRESHPEWSGMHQSDFTVTELKTTQVTDTGSHDVTQTDHADKLVEAAKNLVPYLDWTIGPESPAYHPTMPSAVSAFKHALKEHQEASNA